MWRAGSAGVALLLLRPRRHLSAVPIQGVAILPAQAHGDRCRDVHIVVFPERHGGAIGAGHLVAVA